MDYWKFFSGMLTVRITSAVPERTLDFLNQARIPLFHVTKYDELTCEIQILRKDYSRLSKILQQRGERLDLVKRNGLYWPLKSLFRRPILLATTLVLLVASLFLPSRILFITVEGNTTIPDRMILHAAEECGIRFAASRKLVRSEKVKNALLSALPQLQWAGINTSGCTAILSVRERKMEKPPMETTQVSNLIADQDGYILSTTITSGTPYVFPGDTVIKGQTLISGYTDCGICIRASRAIGEIFAQTNRKMMAVMPENYELVEADSENLYQFSLIIGKKRINLWKDSRISDTGCGRMYEEYFFSLPGDYRLPIALCVDRYARYKIKEALISETNAQMQLQNFSDEHLLHQMISGRILRKQQQLSFSEGLYKLESHYICTEIIGREQREQIGVINGKRS